MDTLLLRLVGKGRTVQDEIDDLLAPPAAAWERVLAVPILVLLRFEIVATAALE